MLAEIFCTICKHVESLRKNNSICCRAFPNGIPYEILFVAQLHNEVLPNQEGGYIFTPKEGYEGYIPKIHILEEEIKLPPLSEMLKKLREKEEGEM